MGPRLRVWSRKISESLERCQVAEALESGSIVIANKADEEGISLGMRCEHAMGGAALWLAADGVGDAAIEALDHTVGLWPVRSGEAMLDFVFAAEAVEEMPAGRPIMRLALHVDGEAVGEFAAIVGEDGVNRMWKVSEEVFEETGGGLGIALGVDFDIDVAGGAVDRDEGVTLASLQSR